MEQFKGKTIFQKIAIGKVYFYEKVQIEINKREVCDTEAEVNRFEQAKRTAQEQLVGLYEKAKAEVGEEEAEIFEVHTMMLGDSDYCDSVTEIINGEKANAEYAVAETGDTFSRMFSEMDDEYMRERAADIKDISERVIRILSGKETNDSQLEEPVILVADDLAPSETIQMDKTKLLGFVTKLGSSNSHTAILARTMGIPALIGVEIDKAWNGKMAVIDGYKGELTIEPDESYLKQATENLKRDLQKQEMLKKLKGAESITKDGKKIKVYSNIGSVSDVGAVLENDGEGIGLFRSEFLYLESKDFPTEEQQFKAYKAVAEKMEGKEVVIRTLDIGADKQVDYFDLGAEENPALGYRAIRICLTQPEIFKTQLRALLRASHYGKIAIMFPMIISVDELVKAKGILEEVKAELTKANIPYDDVEVGIMIETPASVIMSEELAKEADFFSIGTNDLSQYTLAIDRQNPKLDEFFDPHHPAVLRMIQMTVENGHKHGAWVGICGELAADLELTETFIKMGVDELSVSPTFVLPLREKIRSISLKDSK